MENGKSKIVNWSTRKEVLINLSKNGNNENQKILITKWNKPCDLQRQNN